MDSTLQFIPVVLVFGREVLVVFIPHFIAIILAFVALAIPVVLFRLLWKLASKLRQEV
jgi:hypothetical protein